MHQPQVVNDHLKISVLASWHRHRYSNIITWSVTQLKLPLELTVSYIYYIFNSTCQTSVKLQPTV